MTTRVDRLTVVFQASSFCLACFAAVMFGLAEGAALPQFLTIPAAIVAYHVTERTRRFVLPLSWANALGVMALLAAIAEFIGEDVEERLLAGGHQLVYLTWITMFMDKKPRQYWWLCVLGVLQVAVGSVLTLDPWYGMFLLVYLAGIIWTLTVFSIYQAQAGINESAAPPDSPEVSPLVSARRLAPAGAIPFVNGSSVALGSIQIDDGANWIDRRLLLSAAVTLLGSFLMGCLVFMGVPRVWIGASPFGDQHWLPGRNVSGFSETVRLNDLGTMLESSKRVIGVRMFDNDTDEPVDVESFARQHGYDEPLFRGAVMSKYENGRWTGSQPDSRQFARLPPLSAVESDPLVRQEVEIQQTVSRRIFMMLPVIAGSRTDAGTPNLTMDWVNLVVYAEPRDAGAGAIGVTLLSPQQPDQRSFDLWRGVPWHIRSRIVSSNYTRFPIHVLSRTRAHARNIATLSDREPNASPADRARHLLNYLRDSGQFRYMLNTKITDTSIDPMEDFLFNRRTGHCEHFASALTLMLRANGIPARLVGGFKGGVVNELTGTFEVQQRHAHTWVEAYIEDQWTTLDPTPAAERSESVEQFAQSTRTLTNLRMAFRELWSRLVVNISFSKQRRGVNSMLRQTGESLTGMVDGSASGTAPGFMSSRAATGLLWLAGGIVSVMVLAGLAISVIRFRPQLFGSRLSGFFAFGRGGRGNQPTVVVDYYVRFARICGRHGLFRGPSQTQREFARQIATVLEDRLAPAGLTLFPVDLTELFYRERFQSAALDASVRASVFGKLAQFEAALSRRNGRTVALGRVKQP